jgi:accessory colonization factor AcfC
MRPVSRLTIATALAAATVSLGSAQTPELHVYGPGGPLAPMREAAEIFSRNYGVKVTVVRGPEAQWIGQAMQNADLIYGGAEYMLTSFALDHPGLVDPATRTELHSRAAGILVRKGNPKRIRTFNDLAESGIRLVDVNGAGQLGLWEDIAGFQGLILAIQSNIAVSVRTSAEAIEIWNSRPEIDAWISYESWHYRLRDVTDLVKLHGRERILRGTPIAVTTISRQKELASAFIDFLKSHQGHEIFRKWGWE